MTEPTRNDEVVYGTSHSKSDPTLLDSEITNKIGYILKKYSVYCFMGERASDFDEVKAEQAFKNLLLEARYDEIAKLREFAGPRSIELFDMDYAEQALVETKAQIHNYADERLAELQEMLK